MAGAVLHVLAAVGLDAQPTRPQPARPQPVPADTTRRPQQPGDTLPRPSRPDTVRVRHDTITVGAPASDTTRKARIDSVLGIPDTLKTRVRRDSIQAPLARAEVPPQVGVGPVYRWTRDSVLATGAINLTDILGRVPGITTFRSGFMASAQTAAYLGDFAKVRIFRDGVEMDVLDPRAGGVPDVGDIQLGNLDELTVERTAGEIRVHIRTWTVRNTTPYTRVDAFTGDEDTNLYRFFYGRRFGSGFVAQAGVQQFGSGTRNRRVGGGGTVLDALGRFGWSKGLWSADVTYLVLNRQRNLTTAFIGQDELLPEFEGRRRDGTLRVAYGDPDGRGPWVQAIASTSGLKLSGTSHRVVVDSLGIPVGTTAAGDTIVFRDSSAARVQYVVSGGYSIGALQLSATNRLRAFRGNTYNTPSVRLGYESGILAVSAFAERNAVRGMVRDSFALKTLRAKPLAVDTDAVSLRSLDLTSREDVSVRVTPLPWVAVLGSFSHETRALGDSTPELGVATSRLEGALRVGRTWLSAGVVRRGADTLIVPKVYSPLVGASGILPLARYPSPAVNGLTFGARGKVWKDVYSDITGTAWNRTDVYLPQYQVRGEVGVESRWLRRFPSGNFGFKTALIDEYRSRTPFWVETTASGQICEVGVCVAPYNVLTFQLEIRILTGTLSYQLRNALNREYETVPGFRMPGPVSYYGLRWTFWN